MCRIVKRITCLFLACLIFFVSITVCDYNTVNAEESSQIKGKIKVVLNIDPEKMTRYVKAFENKYPGVKVDYICLSDYEGDIKKLMDTGDYGDVIFVPSFVSSDSYADYFQSLGTLSELSSKYSFVQQGKVKDNIVYGLPSSAYLNGILYNKRVFDEAGITKLPQTIDEFIEALKMIKSRTKAIPFYTNYADDWALKTWTIFPYIEMTGSSSYMSTDFLNELNPFESGNNQYEVYDLLNQIVKEGLSEENHSQTNWQHSKEMLNGGDIACMAIGSWALSQCQDAGSNGDDVRYMPFPNNVNGKQYVTLSADYSYGVTKNSKNAETARAFVDFMLDESGYAVDINNISIVPQDPISAAYGDMSNVEVLANDAYDSQSYEKRTAFYNKIDIDSSDIAKKVIESASGYSQASFDDVMSECNTKWESARTAEMQAEAHEKTQSESISVSGSYEVSLSDAEKQYIAKGNTVRVGYLKSAAPFMYEDNGRFKGVASELLQIIGEGSGIRFQYVAFSNTQEALQAVKDGHIDMIAGIVKDQSYSNDIKFSKEYIEGMNVLIKNNSFDTNNINEGTKVVVEGESARYYASTKDTITVPSNKESIEAVNNGSADFTVMDYYTASCYVQSAEYKNISVNPINSDAVFCMGFSNNIDSCLVSICNKYIYSIPDSNIQMMAVKNVNDNSKITVTTFIKDNIVVVLASCIGVLAVILILVCIVLREKMKRTHVDGVRAQVHDALYDLANDFIFEYYYKSNKLNFDRKFERTFGFSGTVELDSYKMGKAVNKIKDIFIKNILNCRENRQSESEKFKINLNGQENWYKITQSIISDSGKPVMIIGKVIDIQAQMEEEQQFKDKAEHDVLTELYNREGFNRRFEELLGSETDCYTIATLDIDDFKKVNDTLGHDGGDEVLKFLADRIGENINSKGIAARTGSDEFIIFLSEVDSSEVKDILKKLVNSMDIDFTYEEKTVRLSISLGAVCKNGYPNKAEMLEKADKLLHQVKEAGKNGYYINYLE